jgi:WD40 repeat protein
LKVWNLRTGKEEKSFVLAGAGNTAYFSPEGSWIQSSTGRWGTATTTRDVGDLKVWDTKTGKEILSLQGVAGTGIFSPDSKLFVSDEGNHALKLWDLPTGRLRVTIPVSEWAMDFSPDCKRLASARRT